MAGRTSHLPGFGVVVEDSTTRTSHLPGFGVVAETAATAGVGDQALDLTGAAIASGVAFGETGAAHVIDWQQSQVDNQDAAYVHVTGGLKNADVARQGMMAVRLKIPTSENGTTVNIFTESSNVFDFRRTTQNKFEWLFADTPQISTDFIDTTNAFADGEWHDILLTWDTNAAADSRTFVCYIDNTVEALVETQDGPAYDPAFDDATTWALATNAGTVGSFVPDICFGDFYLNTEENVDISNAANRRLFFTAEGADVDKGGDGSTPTGKRPLVYFWGDSDNFGVNYGGAGDFIITNTFITCADALDPTGIASTAAFGDHGIETAIPAQFLDLAGAAIASGVAFGSHTISETAYLVVEGIASEVAFGDHGISTPAAAGTQFLDLDGAGIATAEAFGLHSISETANLDLTGAAIASGVAFGSHTINAGVTEIDLDGAGIASTAAFGSHSIREHVTLDLTGAGIASGEVFGDHVIIETRYLDLAGAAIASGEAFGADYTVANDNFILPTGIASTVAFGVDATIDGGVPFVPPVFGEASVNYGESVSTQHSINSSQQKGVGSATVRAKELRRA